MTTHTYGQIKAALERRYQLDAFFYHVILPIRVLPLIPEEILLGPVYPKAKYIEVRVLPDLDAPAEECVFWEGVGRSSGRRIAGSAYSDGGRIVAECDFAAAYDLYIDGSFLTQEDCEVLETL